MAKIFVEAYGCSASFADSEMISGLIVNGGHTLATSPSESDLNLIVTCSVKDTTANKMMYRIKSLKTNNGIYLVPAFTGLGAPYWVANARGILSGLTRDTGPKEIVRATVESVAYQTHDLFEAMKNDGLKPKLIKVDGGMVKNNWFSQFLADVINIKVLRPKVNETTALGAAFMAGLQIGVYKSLKDISKNWKTDKSFNSKMNNYHRKNLIKGWKAAINKTLS